VKCCGPGSEVSGRCDTGSCELPDGGANHDKRYRHCRQDLPGHWGGGRLVTVTPARRLTLSFDNGPHPELTPRVLDVLAAHLARAVFFMIGTQVTTSAGREIARRVVEAGHRIGNHTMTHGSPLGRLIDADAVAEIRLADEVLAEFAGEVPLFRPSGEGRLGPHVFSRASVEYLLGQGHTAVIWNSLPRDWEAPDGSWVSRALADLATRQHTMVVLHDVLPATVDRLGSFLDAVRNRGVEVTDEIPEDCVVISGGERRRLLHGLVADEVAIQPAAVGGENSNRPSFG
jgi:peptidoglycan-N-acetylglucosamine deacetylase